MAVFRITSRTKRVALAKKSIRYIVHRRSQEQEPVTRTLYDQFGETDKYHAYDVMDQAGRRTMFFRTVISPDPATEDTKRDLDLRLLTEATMQLLQRRLGEKPLAYFAAIHTDHSSNRHIHVIMLLEKTRLSKADLKALRWAATTNAREQRRLLDRGVEQARQPQEQTATNEKLIFRSRTAGVNQRLPEERIADRSGGGALQHPICASCGPRAQMHRLTKTLFLCPTCGTIVAARGIGMEVVRKPSLELVQEQEVSGA